MFSAALGSGINELRALQKLSLANNALIQLIDFSCYFFAASSNYNSITFKQLQYSIL